MPCRDCVSYPLGISRHFRFESTCLLHRFRDVSRGRERLRLGGKHVMRSGRFKRLARLGTGALILLLVHGILCASRCPGRLQPSRRSLESDRRLDLNQLDAFIVGDLSSLASGDRLQDPLRQPRPKHGSPCSGPSCSDRAPVAVSTASQGPQGSDQWGALCTLVLQPDRSPPDQTIDEPAPCSIGHNCSIFHPPPA